MKEHKQLDNANREKQATPPHGDPLESGIEGSPRDLDKNKEEALNALPEIPGCPPPPPDGPGRESV